MIYLGGFMLYSDEYDNMVCDDDCDFPFCVSCFECPLYGSCNYYDEV